MKRHTTPEELVRYVAGRLHWISPQGVEEVFRAARDFYAQEGPPPAARSATGPPAAPTDAEQMVKRQMGFS